MSHYPFGDVLRGFRQRARISQEALAQRLNKHRNTIRMWERGDYLPDTHADVIEIARALMLSSQDQANLLHAYAGTDSDVVRDAMSVGPQTSGEEITVAGADTFVLASPGPVSSGSAKKLVTSLFSPSDTRTKSLQESTQQSHIAVVQALRQEYHKRLEHSLQGATMIALGLHERTDVTRSSAQLVFRRTRGTTEHPLPLDTSIAQACDHAGQGLLLLGEPGAGKTTLLLDLALELLMRTEKDAACPIPVILNLSSWARKKTPLASWLIDQLQLVYSVPSRLSQPWLEQGHWLWLLDGLDEVDAGSRAACIEAINLYRVEHFVPLVVCSRSHEYLAQKAQLALPSAVVIQPLQEQQVIEYLKRVGKPAAAVYTALKNDALLRQLITTPLMLSVVVLTYRGKAVKDLPQLGSLEEHQRQIFRGYVDHMLEQQTTKYHFTPQQTQCWLTWLARRMKQHSLTEFYLEWLQPSWLMTKRARIRYQLFSCLAVGLVTGLVIGLLIGLLAKLVTGPLGGLFFGLLGGLFFGSLMGLLIILPAKSSKKPHPEEIRPVEALKWSWKGFWQWLFFGLLIGLFIGLLAWLLTGLLAWLLAGLIGGPLFGLPGGTSGVQVSKDMRTRSNQGIRNSGWNALRFVILVGLPAGLPVVLLTWLFGGGHLVNQLGGLLGGLLTGLFFGLLGIRFFELRGGLFLGSLGSLLGGLLGGLPFVLPEGLFLGLFFGLLVGLLVALPLGGEAYLKHYLLRYLLIQSGTTPWHYVRFLEEATERILLQKVGGGYRFIHPLFLDYFASLDTATSFSPAQSSPSPS